MECPRCGLPNMPGSRLCFQCGADLASPVESRPAAAEDYYPTRSKTPRAHGATYRREVAAAREQSRTWRSSTVGRVAGFWQQNRRHIARATASLVPGLGQLLNGQPARGLLFAAGSAVVISLIASTIRTAASNYLLWTLGSIIWSSVLDAGFNSALLASRGSPARLSRPRLQTAMALISTAIVCAAYATLVIGSNVLFARARLRIGVDVFAGRETILLRRSPGDLQRGDRLFVHLAGATRIGRLGDTDVEDLGGDGVATVLAVPGDSVEAAGGKLSVNSDPVDGRTLVGAAIRDTSLTVAPGECFCLVRLVLALDLHEPLHVRERLSLVRATEVIGRPVAIIDPPPARRWLPRSSGLVP